MGEVIVVVSGKGGVGKTTVAANIGAALSGCAKSVVLIDADMGLRNLDIAVGVENKIVYDIADVLDEICDIKTAVVSVDSCEGLNFIPSPQTRSAESVTPEKFSKLCTDLAKSYDYVIVDGPAGVGDGFLKIIKSADKAIVVTQGYMSALRDADRTISLLEKEGIGDMSVIINAMQVDFVEKGIMHNADYILDVLGINLLGIVPYDESLLGANGKGGLLNQDKNSLSVTAFFNIAQRIMGENIPIMDFDIKTKRKKRFLFF